MKGAQSDITSDVTERSNDDPDRSGRVHLHEQGR